MYAECFRLQSDKNYRRGFLRDSLPDRARTQLRAVGGKDNPEIGDYQLGRLYLIILFAIIIICFTSDCSFNYKSLHQRRLR